MSKKNINLLYWKTVLVSTCFITVLLGCSDVKKNQKAQNKHQHHWVNFNWEGDSISGRYFDKTYITIPFSIEGIPHKFKSQFDLGATSTMVYENSIKPYLNKYLNTSKKPDTVIKANWTSSGKVSAFKSINFKLDTVLFKNQELVYFDKYGKILTEDSIQTKTIKHIGTIGSNIFQNKYLIIDFPNHRIAILDSLNKSYKEKTTFIDIKLDKGRIKVPVTIDGNTQYFMFDTGASMFPLAVTKEDIALISKESIANDTLNISTWGEFYDVHGYKISSNISIGDLTINTKNLNVYDSKKEFKQFYEQEGIMGLMGNSFFLDKKIIIDYKNKKMGIVN